MTRLISVLIFLGVVLFNCTEHCSYKNRESKLLPELNGIKLELQECEQKLQMNEEVINSKDSDIELLDLQINGCTKTLKYYEAESNNGTLSTDVYANYQTALNKCNQLIERRNQHVTILNKDIQSYELQLMECNSLVATANQIIDEIGSATYLVPIPGRKKR
jgi:C4-type Zn-finger protein